MEANKHGKGKGAVVVAKKGSTSDFGLSRCPRNSSGRRLSIFDSDAYRAVYAHDWSLLGSMGNVVIDGARVYVVNWFEGIKSLCHSHLPDCGDFDKHQRLDCERLTSSKDSQHTFSTTSTRHSMKMPKSTVVPHGSCRASGLTIEPSSLSHPTKKT